MEDIPTVSQEIESEAHVSTEIDIDPVVTSTRKILGSLHAPSAECCIYRVPKKLRKVNAEAYTPQVVSIGPFHRGEEHLQAMEEHKLRYLQTFLNRTGRSLEDCVEAVRTWEERARDCYAETIELSSEEFVKMILVDGSFIVELLLRNYFPKSIDESDRIPYKPWMNDKVPQDLVLLENQLPFFVLEGFFYLVPFSKLEETPTFLELTYEYFKFFMELNKLPDSPEIEHFVDFIHHCYLSSFPTETYKGNAAYEWPPSVTKLYQAGVKFKMVTGNSLLDIQFKNGILKIPHLKIQDLTETLFRNIIAFEQCHCKNKYISVYFTLLNRMINTSKDVDLLIRCGIITNMLCSSEDLLELFNNISKEVLIINSKFCFYSPCKNLNAYYKSPWNKLKATLIRSSILYYCYSNFY